MRAGIYGFFNSYRFLSNFYIEPDGTHVEGEYQRAKCAEAQDRRRFHTFQDDTKPLLPPDLCKHEGRRVKLRLDWEQPAESGLPVKVSVMQFYVTKKFRDHPELAERLRDTRGLYLEETNPWGDTYWGVWVISQGEGRPAKRRGINMLGAILMQVRDEL